MKKSNKPQNYVFRKGDIAYFAQEGQICEVLDFYKKEGLFGGTVIKVGCLRDYDHKMGYYKGFFEVKPWTLFPIKDEESKLILKMAYKSNKLGQSRGLW